MINNTIDFKTRKPSGYQPNFKTSKEAVGDIDPRSKELDLNAVITQGKSETVFLAVADNDYHELKKGDLVAVNIELKPKNNDLVVHIFKGKPGIHKLSELQVKTEYKDTKIVGVITHIVRSLINSEVIQ